jgi:hypothetical protein
MGLVNRAYMRNLARRYANELPGGSSAFIPDSDATANAVSLDNIINLKLASFYDLLVQARGHENYAVDAAVNTVAGTATYALPADCYQVLSIHLEWAPMQFEVLHATSVRERVYYQNWTYWARNAPKAYRLRGTQAAAGQTLELFPTPSSAVLARVRYIPEFAPLADDVTTFDSVNGWENLIALAAAIDLRTFAEKDLGSLPGLLAKEEARIRGLADQRSANEAEQVVDVDPDYSCNELMADRRWI